MASIHHCQITDDDGVLILATEANLRALCPPHFDYAFPGVVLDGLRTGHLVAWRVSMAAISDVEITSTLLEECAAGPMYLEVRPDDRCVLLPWSQLTMAFDSHGGEVEPIPGLVECFTLAAGWYEVRVAGPTIPHQGTGAELAWSVSLRPTNAPEPGSLLRLEVPFVVVPEPRA